MEGADSRIVVLMIHSLFANVYTSIPNILEIADKLLDQMRQSNS